MREIVLDTETTGLDPENGDRIVEIGCLELENHLPTGRTYHQYVNPERDMPDAAFAVHGLSSEFLAEHPVFAEVVDGFLEFIGDAPLVIHNAEFDLRFLNAELARLSRPAIPTSRAIDTVQLARSRFPGAQVSLDALCRRFEIDLSEREKHGALVDVRLLAAVYLELVGGRQPGFELAAGTRERRIPASTSESSRPARPHAPSAEEIERHEALLEKLKDPIWRS